MLLICSWHVRKSMPLMSTKSSFCSHCNPWHMRRRIIVVILCVCVSVCYEASCCIPLTSPKYGVVRFLMAFQTYDLYGLYWKRFIRQIYHLICWFWTCLASGSMTLHTNRNRTLCVARYIRYVRTCIIKLQYMHFRHGFRCWSPPPPLMQLSLH